MCKLHLSRKDVVDIRELGGSMAPIWKKYYKNIDAVIVSNSKSMIANYFLLKSVENGPYLDLKNYAIVPNFIYTSMRACVCVYMHSCAYKKKKNTTPKYIFS